MGKPATETQTFPFAPGDAWVDINSRQGLRAVSFFSVAARGTARTQSPADLSDEMCASCADSYGGVRPVTSWNIYTSQTGQPQK